MIESSHGTGPFTLDSISSSPSLRLDFPSNIPTFPIHLFCICDPDGLDHNSTASWDDSSSKAWRFAQLTSDPFTRLTYFTKILLSPYFFEAILSIYYDIFNDSFNFHIGLFPILLKSPLTFLQERISLYMTEELQSFLLLLSRYVSLTMYRFLLKEISQPGVSNHHIWSVLADILTASREFIPFLRLQFPWDLPNFGTQFRTPNRRQYY